MSGIVFEFRRDGAPADRSVAARMLDRLEHRGPDGRRLAGKGAVILGCHHFWTTPEEIGEERRREPLVLLRQRLLDDGTSEAELEKIESEVEAEVTEAIEFAVASPWPDLGETYTDVYAP